MELSVQLRFNLFIYLCVCRKFGLLISTVPHTHTGTRFLIKLIQLFGLSMPHYN